MIFPAKILVNSKQIKSYIGVREGPCPGSVQTLFVQSAIHSHRTIIGDTVRDATVFIADGLIIAIAEGRVEQEGFPLTDVGNSVLMPGIVDTHVHINEPGRTNWEGFDTATKAAISGGVTTLVDMPLNSSPVTTDVASLHKKSRTAAPKLHANCGFWGGVVPGNAGQLEALARQGVCGFKAFLTHSGIEEFPNVTEKDLHQAMPVIAGLGLSLLVHCELLSPQEAVQGDPRLYSTWLASRPKQWEEDAIALMIRLCETYHCPVHIVHLSAATAVEQIIKAKERGLPLTVETAQHYLYFHAEEIGQGRTEFKCAPPIREKANNELLWQALKNGVIDLVATDHSPAPPAKKEGKSGDFMKAWGGIASLQFALPVLWTVAGRHNGTLTDMARWLCEKPAQLMGKNDVKGKIATGYDADLVVWNPEQSFTVTSDAIQHKHKMTPYMHRPLSGVVEQTWIKGNLVYDKGSITQLNKGALIWRA